jgi:L-alanine-DL-glutamate epimerase-like enolase superfamily enzyme
MGTVRFHRVRVPFRVPFATATGSWTTRESWLVRVVDDEGRVGWGEAVLEDEADIPVLEALLGELAAVGLAPSPALVSRAGAAGRAFRAALDGARLDVLAQAPEAMDARPPGVGVNAVLAATNVEAAAAAAAGAVEAGYRTLKIKAAPGDTTATLVGRVAAVRAAAGDDVALRLDMNGTWRLEQAVERMRALAGFALEYVEQPLAPHDLSGAAALRGRTSVPVAADEAVDSVDGARAVLAAGAADVLVVKPARVGGPVPVAEIAALAAESDVPVVVSSMFETGVGLAVALACASVLPDVPGWPAAERDHGLATADLLEDDLVVAPFAVTNGRMQAPFGPGCGGLGVTVDEGALDRYGVDDA